MDNLQIVDIRVNEKPPTFKTWKQLADSLPPDSYNTFRYEIPDPLDSNSITVYIVKAQYARQKADKE